MIRIITATMRGEHPWRVLCFTLWLSGPKLSRLSASQQQCDHYCVLLRLYKWMQQKHTIHEKESLTHLPQLSLEAVYWLSFVSYSTFSSHLLSDIQLQASDCRSTVFCFWILYVIINYMYCIWALYVTAFVLQFPWIRIIQNAALSLPFFIITSCSLHWNPISTYNAN
jgi:hypothetical protein